jgi:outer membrane protein assembly factor BamB
VFERPGAPDELIVCGWGYGVASVDPNTGTRNWSSPTLARRPVSSPIIVGGLVLATCGDGGGNNAVVAVRPPENGEAEPQLAYQIDRNNAPYVPSLVAKDSLVFLWADRGVVACIDAAAGTIKWRNRVGGDYYCSPVRVADRIYCVSVDGEVVCLAASDKYELLGRTPLGETFRSTPAVAGGRMFLRTESHLVAVGQP